MTSVNCTLFLVFGDSSIESLALTFYKYKQGESVPMICEYIKWSALDCSCMYQLRNMS